MNSRESGLHLFLFASLFLALFPSMASAACSGTIETASCSSFYTSPQCGGPYGECAPGAPSYCSTVAIGTIDCSPPPGNFESTYDCAGSPPVDCYSYTTTALDTACEGGGYTYRNGCSSSAPSYCQNGPPTVYSCGLVGGGGTIYGQEFDCETKPCTDPTLQNDQPTCESVGCDWCSSSGQACTGSGPGNCCTGAGLTCVSGTCQAAVTCSIPSGGGCNVPMPPPPTCCAASAPICVLPSSGGTSGNCGSCISAGSATTCTGSGQGNCCSGLTCNAGTCQAAPPCASAGQPCGTGCCTGLSCTSGTCQVPTPPPVSGGTADFCRSDQFTGILQIAAMACLAMAVLIALTYMAGQMTQNPRMLSWAKGEAFQMFFSLSVAIFFLWAISVLCTVKVDEVRAIAGLPSLPDIYAGGYSAENIYGGALLYLENLGGVGLANMASLRYNLGAYEIRTSFNRYDCASSPCLFSLSSTNVADYGGETMYLAITNNLLGIATVSQLSVLFMHFTLRYIVNGLFVEFLPIAIIVRSIPFMRHFGGSLMAIFIALYLFYPAMLVVDAFVAPGLAQSIGGPVKLIDRGTGCNNIGIEVFTSATGRVDCQPYPPADPLREDNMMVGSTGIARSVERLLPAQSTGYFEDSVRLNALIFLAAVFLPALNFIVIAALARDLSRFLGEDSDISRLGQMI